MPRSSKIGTGLGPADEAGGLPHLVGGEPGPLGVVVDVDRRQRREHLVEVDGAQVEELAVEHVLIDEHLQQRGQQPAVAPRTDLEVDVGQVGRLGTLAGRSPRATGRGPWRSPSVSPGRAGTRGTATGSCPRRPRPAPPRSRRWCGSWTGRTAGRRPRTRPSSPGPARSTRTSSPSAPLRGAAVAAAQVVPLTATAVVEDRLPAVGVAHRGQSGRHLVQHAVSQSTSS